MNEFTIKLSEVINTTSQESASDTPDFILAEYLEHCLAAWNVAIQKRRQWDTEESAQQPPPATWSDEPKEPEPTKKPLRTFTLIGLHGEEHEGKLLPDGRASVGQKMFNNVKLASKHFVAKEIHWPGPEGEPQEPEEKRPRLFELRWKGGAVRHGTEFPNGTVAVQNPVYRNPGEPSTYPSIAECREVYDKPHTIHYHDEPEREVEP